ncbi:hypothetical protein DFH29DRAFT_983264 [Suillus ampliporus]|nr:hypothetical protein DFH29DRAFT_983264 [Suillus ampliporus]
MRTKHPEPLRSHRFFHQGAPEPTHSESVSPDVGDINDPHHNPLDAHHAGEEGFTPEAGTWVQLGPLFQAFHPHLTALKCGANGNLIDQNACLPPQTDVIPTNWTPYQSQVAFETAEFLFMRNQMSAGQMDTLLDLWAATLIKHDDSPPFVSHRDLYDTIDATPLGDVAWESFSMSFNRVKPAENVPPWMDATHDVWFHDPHLLIHNMLANPDFDGEIEYTPYWDYNSNNKHCNWAWNQADIIAQNQEARGSMFVPLIIGSDKTTVSVATGHTEYHPLYLSIGNIFNSVRRAHRNGVVLVGFLAIPKTTKEHTNNLFQCSLAKIFESVKPYMTTHDIACCSDGHYWRVIYGLGPYIADYPEQVLLSRVVQGRCPKCLADRKNLDGDRLCLLRCREHSDLLVNELEYAKLWTEYGIVGDLVPFTNDFPHADIHELLAPDLLHQIIKGAFKDHLVKWVDMYLKLTHGTACATEILDDIDRRIAAVAPFAGLRHFPEGRGFKQWTGNDSKALMKVYLPAIKGHVPLDVVRAFSTFLDFCYIVHREALMEDNLIQLQDALDRFHRYREIFKTTGVAPSFSLPRQHSLMHYSCMICLFGAPNGLCSSITESKHIKAVKEPWHHLSRYEALGQMLLTNQRLDKIAAAHTDFEARGMLQGSCISDALQELETRIQSIEGETVEVIDGPTVQAHVDLATMVISGGADNIPALAANLGLPNIPTMIQQFLHDQHHVTNTNPPEVDPATAPIFMGRVSTFSSVSASFYAPSDLSGTGGMRHEHIRATPTWDRTSYFKCAVVHWFLYILNGRDPDTGMYIVAPSMNDNDTPGVSVIHIDSIFRAAHLIPVYGTSLLPHEITAHHSYDIFCAYYVNKYADHHAFEIA